MLALSVSWLSPGPRDRPDLDLMAAAGEQNLICISFSYSRPVSGRFAEIEIIISIIVELLSGTTKTTLEMIEFV